MDGMMAVLTRATAFVLIIVTGYVLKKKGLFGIEDFKMLTKIIVRITLPAAIVYNFSSMEMDYSLLLIILIAFSLNVILMILGYLVNIQKPKEDRVFGLMNVTGHNIGNFTIPFVQSFLGPVGFAVTSLFDAGNAMICMGTNYAVGAAILQKDGKTSIKSVIKTLLSSVPFDTYIIMTIIVMLEIKIPSIVVSYAQTIGNSNAFLALFMIGVGFEIHLEKEKLAHMLRTLVVRYGISTIFAVCAYCFFPFALEVRQALVLVAFAPVASIAPAFTEQLGGDVELASAINSISIVCSIVIITSVLVVIL